MPTPTVPHATRPGPYVPESSAERLAELTEILAAGFLRLQARDSARNSRDLREFPFPLDFAARPSVHESPERPAGENQ